MSIEATRLGSQLAIGLMDARGRPLLGLCLAFPALAVARADSACNGMLMPPEHLREVSRGFGHGHTGIDLMAPMGSPIHAAAGGTVLYYRVVFRLRKYRRSATPTV